MPPTSRTADGVHDVLASACRSFPQDRLVDWVNGMANQYTMRISRLTVDKLGVKLYDKVSAVIAELISNSYDADATEVTIRAPMGQSLATRAGGTKGYRIEVEDNGVGMTPEQTQEFFLVVGAERRKDKRRGPRSPGYGRKVMGRKGVGKLAPFGICKVIEVISSGDKMISRGVGKKTQKGYETSHIIMNFDDIMAQGDLSEDDYSPTLGNLDGTLQSETGTKIILTEFNYRRVPKMELLARQISQRFGISSPDWKITVEDNIKTASASDRTRTIGRFDVETMPNTKIDFRLEEADSHRVTGPDGNPLPDLQPGFDYQNEFYPVRGWIAYSKDPYKDDLMAGIRIYCLGKIAAQTSVFGRGAGFTGEHNVRSYLVGELHADWLDEKEDLIQTDRRDILWSDELGTAFQEWGQRIVKRIGTLARDPSRKTAKDLFFETGNVEKRILNEYPSENVSEIQNRARELAKIFGKAISREEAENPDVVEDLVDLIILFAPHVTLDETMRKAVEEDDTTLSVLSSILHTARISELSSFGRIAKKRVEVIEQLEKTKDREETLESDLQVLIENAPWLINPEWAPVTTNQPLANLKKALEDHYKKKTGKNISLIDFDNPKKRPDFVLIRQNGKAQIVEIKRPGHSLSNDELARIVDYKENMESFLLDPGNAEVANCFDGFHITLVCDEISLSSGMARESYKGLISGELTRINWSTFLARTKNVHEDFLKEMRRQRSLAVERKDDD